MSASEKKNHITTWHKPYYLQVLVYFIGIGTQVAGALAILSNLFENPYYSIAIIFLGTLILCFQALRVFQSQKLVTTSILDEKGEIVSKLQYEHPASIRWVLLVSAIVAVIMLGIFILINLFDSKTSEYLDDHPAVSGVILNTGNTDTSVISSQSYEETRGFFSDIIIYEPQWYGGGAKAQFVGSKHTVRLAHIVESEAKMPYFKGTGSAILFDAEPRVTRDWVRIDAIQIRVVDYEPVTPYKALLPLPYEEARVFYVEIDKPDTGETSVFTAKYISDKNSKKPFGFIRISKGEVESIVVRINAKTPGTYKFDVWMLISSGNHRSKVMIAHEEEYLFDTVNSAYCEDIRNYSKQGFSADLVHPRIGTK